VESDVYRVSLRRYFGVALSQVKPKACSNSRQNSNGSQMLGLVNSMNAYIGVVSTRSFIYCGLYSDNEIPSYIRAQVELYVIDLKS
jgi:hypothetical protein